jgi:uncharacterized protein
MKTQITNSLSPIFKALFVVAILFLGACNDRKVAAQKSSMSAQSKVKAPSIDIHTAVVSGSIEAIKQHIAAGTDINEKDPYGGSSPLISASLFGKTEIAKILIDAGAEINVQNNDGSTALHTAAFFCRPEIVKMLLDKKADKTIRNNYKSTAYESVTGSFGDVKNTYEMMEKMLGPMGLKMDFAYVEKTRPVIAAMLK